ncbi:MAG: HlyD family efflux transporter periplasmic adaptor subunit [Dysgonamonadaceae bacterium]|jgi:multidrug resistance efflux pump|nr:HlyD family efflux transporter periplasmic adaptor subunit [Dysgonamonadaceae bacterium]
MNEENNIELRSEEFQEVLSAVPSWLQRRGITLVFLILVILLTGSYLFKYPDILQAKIIVTTENLPAGVVAKTAGRIDTVFVTEKQLVKQGDKLAYIENPAKLEDVLKLKQDLEAWNTEKGERPDTSLFSFLPVLSSSLGDLQPAYNSFLKSYEDYSYFLTADYHNKKIAVIEKQMTTQNNILQKAKKQLSISRKQLESARKVFAADSTLFTKNVIASLEYEASKSAFLQQQQSYENAKINIDNQQVGILQLEQSVFDLQQQRVDQENALKLSLTSSYDQLSAQIKTWEQTYMLTASTGGIVSFTKYWQKNQNIRSGEVLVTIVPAEKTKIIGKIYLPPQGAGKVKVGQEVNVKFDNFPYMEYGMIRVRINSISLVPLDDGNGAKSYILEVEFPGELVTNYGKTLTFSQEMTGTAEIITEDLRLIDRFLNPIREVIKR